ncbi:LIC_12616 family protein [Lactiplantibacillus nangangensis]|uniref:LIC_12616 family protein n=1 Tax=Lactiplantibacillus nangangensis TaxID=2559917 RepID=A0ABW1SLH9_9LACO|nr:hypothetical protein [Lactiplantibacillus nangangensis]
MLVDLLIAQIKNLTGCETVETDYSGPQPTYPFFSYKITTPYIQIVQQMTEHEPFELTVSINAHADNTIQSLQLATSLAKQLKTEQVRQKLRIESVVVVDIDSMTNRSAFQSDDYERITGFDIHLRVVDNFEEDTLQVNKVNLDGKSIKKE